MTKTLLGQKTLFTGSAEWLTMNADERAEYQRHDASAAGYAWGRLDAGHAPVVTLTEGEKPSTTDTAWAFGGLYARMQVELNDQRHPRRVGFALQSAWEIFASTGCPSGDLPSSYAEMAEIDKKTAVAKTVLDIDPLPPFPDWDETESLLRYLGANVDVARYDNDYDALDGYEKLFIKAQRMVNARATKADVDAVMEHLLERRATNVDAPERYTGYTKMIELVTVLSAHQPWQPSSETAEPIDKATTTAIAAPPVPQDLDVAPLLRYLGTNVGVARLLLAQAQRMVDARASTVDSDAVIGHLLERRATKAPETERYSNYTMLVELAKVLAARQPR